MRIGASPQALAADLERQRRLARGEGERYTGYGVLGLCFASGHVLAFRRFVATSLGGPFTSVWHRTPGGSWTIYATVTPSRACPRLFGRALDRALVEDIDLAWTGPTAFTISVKGIQLQWAIRVRATVATRALSGIGRLMPTALWRDERVLDMVGAAAGKALGAGRLQLHGRAPNGQIFSVVPKAVWEVEASAAVLGGEDLGPVAVASEPPRIGALTVPSRGILAFIDEFCEALDESRHSTAVTRDGDPPPAATADTERA